jgi:hypothetical protein
MSYNLRCEDGLYEESAVCRLWTQDGPTCNAYLLKCSLTRKCSHSLLNCRSDLDILATAIGNAYINANVREKVYFIAGDEFGASKKGKRVVIIKALHGLKTSGAAWRAHFTETLHGMGYTSSLADPDVWFKAECKPDGFEYYSYV